MENKHIIVPGSYTNNNKAQFIRGGGSYFAELGNLIDSAAKTVHVQCYIFIDDETGNEIATHLKNAAQRGVKTYLLVDGYASQNLSGEFLRQLRDAGVYFNRFQPLFKSKKFYFGRRLHHKVAVADGMRAIVGGINITNRYNDMPGVPGWLDVAIGIEGPAAIEIERLCCSLWNGSSSPKAIPAVYTDDVYHNMEGANLCSVRVRQNDWVKNKHQISKGYSQMFNNAASNIIIMGSYFLPGWKFRKQMAKAVKRGVSIKIIVAGFSDIRISKHAERYLYSWLLKNNIDIYEYQKNILHAKIAVMDDRLMTIGSYNLNNISAYASIELNLDVRNKPFVSQVSAYLREIIEKDCLPISPDKYQQTNNIFRKVWQLLSFEIIKIILYLFTFYFRKERPY